MDHIILVLKISSEWNRNQMGWDVIWGQFQSVVTVQMNVSSKKHGVGCCNLTRKKWVWLEQHTRSNATLSYFFYLKSKIVLWLKQNWSALFFSFFFLFTILDFFLEMIDLLPVLTFYESELTLMTSGVKWAILVNCFWNQVIKDV